jgi:hypothetical protein
MERETQKPSITSVQRSFFGKLVLDFNLCWVNAMSQIDIRHLLLPETALDVDGGYYFITSSSVPFTISIVDYVTVGIILLLTRTIYTNSFHLFVVEHRVLEANVHYEVPSHRHVLKHWVQSLHQIVLE